MREDINRWNHKYLAGNKIVNPKLEAELEIQRDLLGSSGVALELAAGRGANALFLATLGYDVVAADGALEGLKICRQAAICRNLCVMPVVMDFDDCQLPKDYFDLVSTIRFLNRKLLPTLMDSMKLGGLLFYKTFNKTHLRSHPNFNPEYLLEKDELIHSFPGLEIIEQCQAGNQSYIFGRKVA